MKAYLPQSRDCETPINHVLALSVLIRPLLFGVAGIFAAAIILNPHAAHAALGPNRIANPSLETAATSEDPQGWFRGRWGTNTAVFTYPVAGLEGARAARVALTSRTSGDAKWYFADV
ncbi:MAG: hypothetical protein Q8Q39_05345, partial [bacterium]|nr:hypothetical protein [bacterium]